MNQNMDQNTKTQAVETPRKKHPPLSSAAVQISGARALANLLLLEHDFRRIPQQIALARLVVDKLSHFTNYDCALFWLASPHGRIKALVISGVDDGPDGKLMRQWGRAAAKWLAKSLKDSLKQARKKSVAQPQVQPQTESAVQPDAETADEPESEASTEPAYQPEAAHASNAVHIVIDADRIPDKVLNIWPETVPMSGLCVPIKTPPGKLMGGILLLREEDWATPVRVLLDQMAEAAAYSLCAIALGIYSKTGGWGRRIMRGLFFILASIVLIAVGMGLAALIM